jgi:AcrR family transcriptional regulator
MRTAADDLTARARIRESALFVFARDGFSAPLRAIAQHAGVSVALITHHYETKDGLRDVCDDLVLERYREGKLFAIAQPAAVGDYLADSAEVSVWAVYMLRSFMDPGPRAKKFFDRLLEQITYIMELSFEAGMVKPEAMTPQMIRQIAVGNMGGMVLEFAADPSGDPREFFARVYTPERMIAELELGRHGYFTDSPIFQQYIEALKGAAQ